MTLFMALSVALSWSVATAHAEEETKPNLIMPWGMSLNVGGGVTGFVDEDMRDFADEGGAWDARFVAGTRSYIAFEAAYTGGAQNIDALGLDSDAVLLSTGLEGAVRLNFMTDEIQPYILAGAGWRHYAVTNESFNTSSVRSNDDVLEVPLGAGISYRYKGLVADLRGIFRPAFDNDLVATRGTEAEPELHSWSANGTVGWEF
jgi:hypothetical protein